MSHHRRRVEPRMSHNTYSRSSNAHQSYAPSSSYTATRPTRPHGYYPPAQRTYAFPGELPPGIPEPEYGQPSRSRYASETQRPAYRVVYAEPRSEEHTQPSHDRGGWYDDYTMRSPAAEHAQSTSASSANTGMRRISISVAPIKETVWESERTCKRRFRARSLDFTVSTAHDDLYVEDWIKEVGIIPEVRDQYPGASEAVLEKVRGVVQRTLALYYIEGVLKREVGLTARYERTVNA